MKKLKTIDIYTLPLLVVSLAAAALRSIALLTSFNNVTMHFDDKVAIWIGGIMVALSTIAFLTYLIFGEKEQRLIDRSDNAASYIPAGIVSCALIFMGVNNIILSRNGYSQNMLSILSLVSGILAILSAVSFFLSVFIEHRDNLYKAAFSLCIVLFLAVYALLLYFNKEIHPTNSPNRLIDQLAYLSAAIFFLFEARIPLGRAKWRGYVTFGLISTLLCIYSSIPALVLYFVKGQIIAESLIESILTLTVAIFICSKVMQIKRLTADVECEAAQSIASLAIARKEEIDQLRRSSRAQDNINEENEDVEEAENYSFDIPFADSESDSPSDDTEE